jgi:fructose/tagatose bisphosphate aldolase
MGRGVTGFTVPAINLRGLTYDSARAVMRAVIKNNVGAFIFEIARSEIVYTEQRPREYATVILAAAIKEGFKGPLFIQGDHFQFSAKKFKESPDKETNAIKDLTMEAIEAGFYNIDIDSSTLVELEKPNILEQQRNNYTAAANVTEFIRQKEPKGITISVGGEIGEVGGKNSTLEELRGFMDGYLATLKKINPKLKGLSKISVQTGTSHGGVVLPDGSIAKVKLDFDTLKTLSKFARDEYGMSGAVQHGASTLPAEAFHRFPETETAEVHLATEFQNMIYENPAFPKELRDEIYAYLHKECADEKKPDQTEEQFIYKTRKKGFGPFKKKMWDMPTAVRERIGADLENKFAFLFQKLNVVNTKGLVDKYIKLVKVSKPMPQGSVVGRTAYSAEDAIGE